MLRLVFMGTPAFAVPTLAELLCAGHDIVAVYTQPPRPAGRGMAATKSAVHEYAEASGIPVSAPASLRSPEAQEAFARLGADAAIVVAYGLMLPKPVLQAPRYGCFNLHASKLPRWRGAAPIQRAIMAGDTETAVMVMQMEEGLDTGPICLGEQVAIGPDSTAGELHDILSTTGAQLMVRAMAALERGSLVPTPQPALGVTYAAKIHKGETRIDFRTNATEVHNKIRGLSPSPGAWLELKIGGKLERVKVLRSTLAAGNDSAEPGEIIGPALTIQCGDGAVCLTTLQRAGKAAMPADLFLRGVSGGAAALHVV